MKGSVAFCFAIIFVLVNTVVSAQTCILTSPSNMIIKAESGKEGAIVNFPDPGSFGTSDCGSISYTPASGSFFRIGSHSIILTTSSGQKSFFTLTVTDNEPPVLSEIRLSEKKLLPSQNMKKVAVWYTVSDNAEEVKAVLSINSNDTESNSRDWEIINNHMVRLKTTPLPDGTPRVYTITVSCSDVAGNITKRTTSITASQSIASAYTKNESGSGGQPLD